MGRSAFDGDAGFGDCIRGRDVRDRDLKCCEAGGKSWKG